jgi:hypothetical protein
VHRIVKAKHDQKDFVSIIPSVPIPKCTFNPFGNKSVAPEGVSPIRGRPEDDILDAVNLIGASLCGGFSVLNFLFQ